MEGQYTFAPNGNISPCPYMDKCRNYPSGCKGGSFWCGRNEKDLERGKYDKTRVQTTSDDR